MFDNFINTTMKKLLIALLSCLPLLLWGQSYHSNILTEIKTQAAATHSDAVIIVQDGKMLYEDFFGNEEQAIYIASAGKSLVSLAIGKLLDDGLLDSLDQPLASLFPEWRQGNKKDITVRMLLNHTSGIQDNPNASVELEPAPDYQVDNVIQLALAAELSDLPGEKVNYNNKAVALLGGVVEKASGKRFDEYFRESFYEPMQMTGYDWIKDKAGQPTTHGAFVIKPSDFLKFGELVLSKGKYRGQRILSENWIDQSLQQGQPFTPIWGLLWWRLPAFEKRLIDQEIWTSWEKANVDPAFLNQLAGLKDQLYESRADFYAALEKALGRDWSQQLNQQLPSSVESSKRIYGEQITAYYADGFRGNYLVIIPEYQIIAIRCVGPNGFNYETDFFSEFVSLVAKLGKAE